MPLLELEQLRKDYGGLRALDGVTLAVPEGAIIGLIGPNGSGKSTLIDLVAGGIAPTAGQIRFAGEQIGGLGAAEVFQRGIARGYQQPTLYFKMTALDNLLLPPKTQLGERPVYAPWHRDVGRTKKRKMPAAPCKCCNKLSCCPIMTSWRRICRAGK